MSKTGCFLVALLSLSLGLSGCAGKPAQAPQLQSVAVAQADLLLPQNLEYAAALDDFSVERFLRAQRSELDKYQVEVKGQSVSVAAVVQDAARRYSINPRVLLVLLELKTRLVSEPSPDKLPAAAGYAADRAPDAAAQVEALAHTLAEAYRAACMGEAARAIRLSNAATLQTPERLNTASYAIWKTLGETSTLPQLEQALGDPSAGFGALYTRWFGDPFALPAFAQNISLPPDARLPFEGAKYYTGGPHVGGFCTQQNIAASSGLDFARSGEKFELLSIAEGQYLGKGDKTGAGLQAGKYVLLQHPGGAQTMYWHLDDFSPEIQAASPGQYIPRGFPLGWAGQSGNQDAVHLHLELRVGAHPDNPYSGVRLGWDGQKLDGWDIWMLRWPGAAGKGISYRGSATLEMTRAQSINNVKGCDQKTAEAIVAASYPVTATASNKLDRPRTAFANYPDVVALSSTNQRNAYPVDFAAWRVSVASDGAQGDQASSYPAISASGRYVAFESLASNLVPTDTNNASDIFVHDLLSGQTTRVSVGAGGAQGDDFSYRPALSADGRYAAFHSLSRNLVWGDTNNSRDVFVHDRQTGQTVRVSVSSDGAQGDADSREPALSADGRYAAFYSMADNLTPGDANNLYDVFLHDLASGQTRRVSLAWDGAPANGASFKPALSADGRYVAFYSIAGNLVLSDTNNAFDVFVYDQATGQTARVSLASDGAQANGSSANASISAGGRYVAFESLASNLAAGDANGCQDVFVHDRQTGQTTLVSVSSDGAPGNASSGLPVISADGRYVAFTSYASNLAAGDTNGKRDVFVHDRQTGQTRRVSVDSDEAEANEESVVAAISADGSYVAFTSKAGNLTPGDANNVQDIFVRGPAYFISGRVLDRRGQPVTGVMISAGRRAGLTDASGAYTLTGLISGAFTLAPTAPGCLFEPTTRTVSLPAARDSQDFTARRDLGWGTLLLNVCEKLDHDIYLPLVLR